MEDVAFEDLRAALAPERDATSRLGALYMVELSFDGDDRFGPLFATLLRDRSPEIAASAAAIAYRSEPLKQMVARDLTRQWSLGRPEYRTYLLQHLDPACLAALGMDFAQSPDLALRLALLARLHEALPDDCLDPALFLSHDSSAEVRRRALDLLTALRGAPARAAALRLKTDPDPHVRVAAARCILAACDPEEAKAELSAMMSDDDYDVRGLAVDLMRDAQARINLAAVEPLVAKQREHNDAGEYNAAMGLAAQVFMRVAEHAGCQYQMARASAGLGDTRRALHLLANALQAEPSSDLRAALLTAAESDPLFAAARSAERWATVAAYADS